MRQKQSSDLGQSKTLPSDDKSIAFYCTPLLATVSLSAPAQQAMANGGFTLALNTGMRIRKERTGIPPQVFG